MGEEYEVKVRVRDLSHVRSNMVKLGGVLLGSYVEEDYYVDLRECVSAEYRDLVFRVRVRDLGGVRDGELTVKGPKKWMRTFKVRDEFNVRLERAEELVDFLKNLSFKVLKVVKRREVYSLRGFKIFLDDVLGLGSYVEVELGAEADTSAEEDLRKLLEELGAGYEVVGKSYAEMLVEVMGRGE